jgi:CRISPR-associated protein Cmr1
MAERKLPAGMENPPDAQSSFTEKMIVETREYELITPLFGGGVEPNTPDPVTTIRATEIRGHLRFWWRATRGGQFATIEELKAKEDEIWGTAAKFDKDGKAYGPSPVSISVL